jgi:hypothetical protein
MKGVKALMNAAEEAKRLKAAAKDAGVLPKGQQAVLSAAENTATVSIPISRQERITRKAISPRLATSTFLIMYNQSVRLRWQIYKFLDKYRYS